MLKKLIQNLIPVVCASLITTVVVFAESEPNNTPATATPLALNGSDAGFLSSSSDQIDWWVVTTIVDGSLYIETNSDAGVDVDLHIYDDIDGNNVVASYDISVGQKETTHHHSLLPGTYYIKANYAGGTGGGNYSILCTFTPTSLTNDPELNDSSEIAAVLDPNSSSTGHLGHYYNNYTDVIDWWKITTTSDGALVVNTTSDPTIDIDMHLYSANDDVNWIASYDTSIGIHEATHRYDLAPGTYYIKAYPMPIGGYGSYTISNVYTPTGLANDTEPNDSMQIASTLAVNDSTTGHLGYYNQGYDDNSDWWKVTIPEDGNLIVRTYSDATLDIDLHMYAANDHVNWIASYDTSIGRNEATHYNGLKAGTYYVHAYPIPTNGYGSYRIYSSFVAAKLANDVEPNDVIGAAQPISLNSLSTGHLGFFGNGTTDTYDFYTFTLPIAWDSLFVRTDSDPTIDIDLKLYDQSGIEIASSGASGSTELMTYLSAGASTYSIRLYRYSGYGSYGVIVSNTRPNSTMVDVKEKKQERILPKNYALSQNFPNPFNPSTSIQFQIPNSGHVTLKVYNMLGCEIASLINEVRSAGVYNFTWNASNLPSGVYFYRLQAGNYVEVKKAVLMK